MVFATKNDWALSCAHMGQRHHQESPFPWGVDYEKPRRSVTACSSHSKLLSWPFNYSVQNCHHWWDLVLDYDVGDSILVCSLAALRCHASVWLSNFQVTCCTHRSNKYLRCEGISMKTPFYRQRQGLMLKPWECMMGEGAQSCLQHVCVLHTLQCCIYHS